MLLGNNWLYIRTYILTSQGLYRRDEVLKKLERTIKNIIENLNKRG